MATTPCQEAPEAWVGDDPALRVQAAIDCLKCPVFDACRDGKFGTPGRDDSGVWAGVEYIFGQPVKSRAQFVQSKPCTVCAGPIFRGKRSKKEWENSRFCSKGCYAKARATSDVPESKSCEQCGETFKRPEGRSPSKWSRSRFCGNACRGMSQRKVAA